MHEHGKGFEAPWLLTRRLSPLSAPTAEAIDQRPSQGLFLAPVAGGWVGGSSYLDGNSQCTASSTAWLLASDGNWLQCTNSTLPPRTLSVSLPLLQRIFLRLSSCTLCIRIVTRVHWPSLYQGQLPPHDPFLVIFGNLHHCSVGRSLWASWHVVTFDIFNQLRALKSITLGSKCNTHIHAIISLKDIGTNAWLGLYEVCTVHSLKQSQGFVHDEV